MADRVVFTRPAATRIAKVVRIVEAGDRQTVLPPNTPRFDDSNKNTFLRLGTYTGAWATATYNVVTISGTTNTTSVKNWCVPAYGSTTSTEKKKVIFSTIKGTASVVEIQVLGTASTCFLSLDSVDLRTLSGYLAGAIQILGHNSTGPCLQWYSIATCTTT